MLNRSVFPLSQYVLIAIVYLVAMVGIAYSLGGFSLGSDESAIRVRNSAIAMPLMTVFALVSINFAIYKCFQSLSIIMLKSDASKYTDIVLANFQSKLIRLRRICLILAIAITFMYLYVEDLFAIDLAPIILFMNISAVPFWFACLYFLFCFIEITRYVIANFLDRDSMDFFNIKELKPLSDLVIYNTSICIGFIALIPIFWIGKKVPLPDLILTIIVALAFAFYLFSPVFRVRATISNKKRLAIARINLAIEKMFQRDVDTKVFEKPEEIRHLAALISTKQEIHEATTWPVEFPQSVKGICIAAAVPVSWAVGSIVENVVVYLTTMY